MTSSLTFNGIDAAKLDKIREAIKQRIGVDITSTVGQASAEGYTLGWSYYEAGQTLVITALKRPWLVPDGMVESELRRVVETAGEPA